MPDKKEEYKTIPEFPNYEISRDGKVRNKSTLLILKYFLAGGSNGMSYPAVQLCNNGKKKNRYIHRLIHAVWNGEKLTKEIEVNHRDKNVWNFDPTNYESTTRQGNMFHKKYGFNSDQEEAPF